MNKIVITGGPCSGKTTLVNELKSRGYPVLEESARKILSRKPQAPKKTLATEIFHHQLQAENSFSGGFMDRSLIDSIAYSIFHKVSLPKVTLPKYDHVFILKMLNFVNDSERTETEEEAKFMHSLIEKTYRSFGYNLKEIPAKKPSKRVDIILNHLNEIK